MEKMQEPKSEIWRIEDEKQKVKYEEKNNNLIVIRKKGGCSLLTNLNVKQKIFNQILSSKYYNKKNIARMKSILNILLERKMRKIDKYKSWKS